MRGIQTFFLRAKHWQVCLLIVGIPVAGKIAVALTTKSPALDLAIDIVAYVVATVWFWAVGDFVGRLTRTSPQLYFLALLCLTGSLMFRGSAPYDYLSKIAALLLSVFLLVCAFYQTWFLAWGLEMAERGAAPELPDYLGTLVLVFLWPIGIWWVQLRVNNLYDYDKKYPEPLIPNEA